MCDLNWLGTDDVELRCVSQSYGRSGGVPFTSGAPERGSGGVAPVSSRYPSALGWRKSNSMLPPAPVSVPQGQCNPLEEPSPLGLTLKKTPSLLDLITYQLQHNASAQAAESEESGQGFGKARIGKCLAPTGSAAQDKLKASNFPASTLTIGTWKVGVWRGEWWGRWFAGIGVLALVMEVHDGLVGARYLRARVGGRVTGLLSGEMCVMDLRLVLFWEC